MIRSSLWAGALLLCGAGALAGCSQDSQPLSVRNLDRPSELAFACYGDYRENGGNTAEGAPHELKVSAQPIDSCVQHASGEAPDGQEDRSGEDLQPPRLFGFVLQSSRGTVAVVDGETQTVQDSDPLTPGKNAIPIGTLPVGLTGDASGCWMVSASAATGDLAVLDVTSALDARANATIARVPILDADGAPVPAKPRTLIGGAQVDTIGLACPDKPSGLVYVAYPGCHLVAVVNAETGQIEAGLRFAEDGTATVTDGAVAAECAASATPTAAPLGPDIDAGPGLDAGPDGGAQDGGPDGGPSGPDAGPPTIDDTVPRPVALHRGSDGRIYIASENSPIITVVEVGEDGLPAAVTSVQLEGAVGVTSLALSDVVVNGGENGSVGGSGGESRFLYAVATDRTVRVVKVGLEAEPMVECDTQVDPRFVYDENLVSLLPCFPVGGPDTPARRPGAVSPGISMPLDDAPLDVAFAQISSTDSTVPIGLNLAGTFAFVTTTRGSVYIVNVDDDVYPDFEDPSQPGKVSMSLALPHQIRDAGSRRDAEAEGCGTATTDPLQGGPRLATSPSQIYSTARIAQGKLHLLPSVRQVECTFEDQRAAVSELAFTAPIGVRELAFPDWKAARNQDWSFVYEGALSRDGFLSNVDGPAIRSGVIEINADHEVLLHDPGASFCQLGVEPFDSVQLLGCDPGLGDGQCGLGQTCYVHPETPTVVTTGVCLPVGRTEELAAPCRDFLITRRQFAVAKSNADKLTLVPRRRVLRTTPLDGCESDDQCVQMAQVEATLTDPAHPVELGTPPELNYDWVCTQDPSRPPGPDRCLMACELTDQCEAGNICLAGFCNEGVPPGPDCVEAVQRYLVRATEAFALIGSSTGYLHNRVRDETTGECIADPNANPLMVGRIPLRPPACPPAVEAVGAEMQQISPNPCRVDIDQLDFAARFELQGNECVADGEGLIERTASAIRVQTQGFRMHLVDTETQGDASCNGDRAGELPPFSAVYPGYEIDITVTGGFIALPVSFLNGSVIPTFPVRITRGPDGRLWVVDEGDGSGSAGRLFTVVPVPDPVNGFTTVMIQ